MFIHFYSLGLQRTPKLQCTVLDRIDKLLEALARLKLSSCPHISANSGL
jgi:hypothetical protein